MQLTKATRKISDDTFNYDDEVIDEAQYKVSQSPRQFKCNKPLQEAVLTLNNSKVHFCHIDTDSMYLAIADSQIEVQKQKLRRDIKDQEFFDQHNKEWPPWDNCTIAEEKKLMSITTESQGENIVCLAPK
ncbi:MAG: hypothetical protein EZS28_005666 [Streblomastix strix]|uniref:Uncharacterized protein n=1 Tax=Streblomastix strix TaxID=222440 RepID=A0A5J4WV58_9EUKA|nr:MAG: hypothetical protein EZS28_005666 [Streblomastix strix]